MITQEQKIDLNKYMEFVDTTTSHPSKSNTEFVRRIENLNEKGVNIARLMTAAVGLTAEAGEFTEIVKKIAFQGKELNVENHEHMVKELGDVFWYFTQACLGLGVDVQTIVVKNMIKLTARYPEGTFDIYMSENRKEGDI
jgi:NTP pyrophosphatase (non-canonical NTP hydrolase)